MFSDIIVASRARGFEIEILDWALAFFPFYCFALNAIDLSLKHCLVSEESSALEKSWAFGEHWRRLHGFVIG